MKKLMYIIAISILSFLLSSCFGSNNSDQINQAKKDLGVIESSGSTDSGGNVELENKDNTLTDTGSEENIQEEKVVITPVTEEQFIELDDLSNKNFSDGGLEITGKTLTTVDKIIVTFENTESGFPKDVYTLKQFTSGSKTFTYRAFTKYQTFDFGKNIYTIEAYSGDKVSTTQLVLNYVKDEENKDVLGTSTVNDGSGQVSLDSLPVGATFGNPVDLGNGNFSYSDLKGLEISKYSFPTISCETLTNDLSNKINTWFFWNTCRPLSENKGFNYFIIRLDGDKYVYEKHYYLSEKGIYGVQELETGEGVTKDNLGEKNQELKDKNEEFTVLKATDDLFKKITE